MPKYNFQSDLIRTINFVEYLKNIERELVYFYGRNRENIELHELPQIPPANSIEEVFDNLNQSIKYFESLIYHNVKRPTNEFQEK